MGSFYFKSLQNTLHIACKRLWVQSLEPHTLDVLSHTWNLSSREMEVGGSFKVIFGYLENWKPTWDTKEAITEIKRRRKKKENDKLN